VVSIVDDGVGPQALTDGHGLNNMARRAEQLGGSFRLGAE
jgi:signal transduction histidine kinase